MNITKQAGVTGGGGPDGRQLEQINRQAKAALTAEQVYVFSVRLCDDQPDRDFERFSQEAIKALAPMFIGKTGILDHAWSADKQVARVFDTSVEYEDGAMYLKAWAYMLRSEKNREFIDEIQGGIKKEVSIGCAMGGRICSICGAEYGACQHRKGERYAGQVCHGVLTEPTDAYEFSFVAVPAQPQAGVLKKQAGAWSDRERKQLEQEAALGRAYRKELEADFVRLGLMLELGLKKEALEQMARGLEAQALQESRGALKKRAAGRFMPVCQLPKREETARDEDSAFLI